MVFQPKENIMKIHCHTNLDLHHCERWPEELPCRPVKGDIITSSTGLELEVCRITFKEHKNNYGTHEKSVTIAVELHLVPNRFEHISAFEKWYKGRNR